MKLTVSKSKNSATFYIQKSIRKSNGSVTTVTIEKLGNLDMVRTRANGKDPYIWAKKYVDELNRKEYEEQKVLSYYGIDSIIICTDAGPSSNANRKFNNKTLFGERIRSFITTQSIKQLPKYLKEFALDSEGWSLQGETGLFNLNNLDEQIDYNKVFYKERWIKEDLSDKKVKEGNKALEQHLIVSFSLKYKKYHRKIRQGQIDRANKLILTDLSMKKVFR